MKARGNRLQPESAGPPETAKAGSPDNLEELCAVLDELLLPDDIAELRQFVGLCRNSLAIRSWLFARFAKETGTQSAFRRALSTPGKPETAGRLWSSHIAEMVFGQPKASAGSHGPYGGLTRNRLLILIARHQYELMDLKTFLLVRLWMRCAVARRNPPPASLCRVTIDHWAAMVADSEGQLMRHAMNAVRFFHERINRSIGEIDFGPHNSWKIHLLLHILDSPKPRYRVAELQAGLPPKYRYVEQRAIRRFCQRCGIRRDTRPGRRPFADRRESGDSITQSADRFRAPSPRATLHI